MRPEAAAVETGEAPAPGSPPGLPAAELWSDLLSAALVGTARRSPPPHALVAPGPDGGPAEAALLASAAVLAAYRRAGRRAAEAPRRLPPAAEPDHRPACPPGALDVLELILSGEVPIPGGVALLAGQWLEGAARAGCRLPARLLPALLELGLTAADLQPVIREVAGPRARWLAGCHDRWGWAAAEPADTGAAERRFATAGRSERVALLEAVRRADPGRGLDLLASTGKSDPAAERAAFLAVLAVGLSGDDEPFLEAALDDRAGGVRQVAADLLGRLRSSRRAARMAERLRPLVTLDGRGAAAALSVARPPVPGAAERRDGINDAAPSGMGVSDWRLVQLVAGAPLSFWTEHLGTTPERVLALAAAPAGDTPRRKAPPPANPVLIGLEQAIAARSAADWAGPLFALRPTPAALAAMPPGPAADALARFLSRTPAPGPAVAQLMGACAGPWPERLGDVVLDRYRQLGSRAALELPAALPVLAARLDPSALPLVETWSFALAGEQALRRRVQTLGHALSLRAAIQREFP
ncbi:MAG TPA: DUF5691 domain-containing protein [Acidimicrobiia bacterium]|nr:DUF5691 domain-containing protein [Acidimicrobiia bacterium]